jgi:hypothetical protein
MNNFILAVGIALAAAPAFAQSKTADVPQAPVPSQILSGKRVFIAYSGGENLSVPLHTVFSGRSDRVYNQFYAAMKEWGKYELVSAPADADLVFEVGLDFNGDGMKIPQVGRVRLDIRDPRSNVLLWGLSQYVQFAVLKGNRDKNLDQAVSVIIAGVKDLVNPAPAPAQP